MQFIYACLLLSISLLWASTSQASVVHKDWKNSGDQLVSFDQHGGLDWLKLSATAGKTLTYVTTHLGDEFQGWRLPTVAEVRAMAEARLGAALLSPAFNSGNGVPLSVEQRQLWYAFMGITYANSASWGYVEPSNISGIYGIGIFPGTSFHNILYGESAKNGHAHTYFTGIYLVRDAIMDVSAPAGLGIILCVFGLLSHRKTRHKRQN